MDGSQATVDEEYFVIETIVDDDGNVGTLRYVVLEAQFDPNENRATAVVYNGNGGTTETGSTTIGESYLVNKTFNILGEVHLHSWNHPDRACRSRAVDEEEKESIKFALPVEKHPSS